MNAQSQFNLTLQDFLSRPLVDSPYIYFDHWSGLHLLSGFILGILFAKYYRHRHAWLMTVTLLAVWEVFELATDWIIFAPEVLIDRTWDLIVGMMGFSLTYYWWLRRP